MLSALTRERARPARIREWPHAWWLAVATVCFGAFMGQLDASIVTLAYRPLRNEFGTSLAAVQWVSLSYLLVLAALLIPVGRLADAHGRKLVYLYGFVLFSAASAACGLAPSLGALIGFRALQGVGAAMLQANSIALVLASTPRHRVRATLGVQAAAQAIGLALGPTVGGLLVSTLGWRWVFGINVPVGVVAAVAGVYLLPRSRSLNPARTWDRSGVALLAAATPAGLLGVSAASGLGLPGGAPTGLLVLAAACVAGFLLRERRAAAPLVDPTLFGDRTVSAGLVGALCGYLVLFGPLVLVPIVLTDAGSSALHAGLVLTALPAGFALAATLGERMLPSSWSDRRRAGFGAMLGVVVLAALVAAPLTTAWLAPLLAALGGALGLFTPANNALVMRAVPSHVAGTGGGLLNMTRSLGTALGVAAVTLALHLRPGGTHLLDGPRTALLVLAAAAIVALLSAHLLPSAPEQLAV
ncbi:MAG: MFS transporter [Cellulomonas sp.]|uniref:MFS transporter n=1 Tax=Cellulomonas sp. TaxID=40001 RepID=UPI0018188EDE|nr:MFS transporter [Cellulomonas sp.]NMM30007.1 MFS transporter [Cellulomonas sp.]